MKKKLQCLKDKLKKSPLYCLFTAFVACDKITIVQTNKSGIVLLAEKSQCTLPIAEICQSKLKKTDGEVKKLLFKK